MKTPHEALPSTDDRPTAVASDPRDLIGGEEIVGSQIEIERAIRALEGHDRPWWKMSLSMPKNMETAWRGEMARSSIRLVQGAITMAFFFYSLATIYAVMYLGLKIDVELLTLFIVFGCPGNVALMFATMIDGGWRYMRAITIGGVLLHTVGMYLIYMRAHQMGMSVPTELLTMQIIFDLFLLGLCFKDAMSLVILALMIAPLAARTDTQTEIGSLFAFFFILGSAFVSATGCYMTERVRKISWLRSMLLKHLAERDALTGLTNRGAFFSRGISVIKFAQRENKPLAVIAIDVDHFKKYNDTFGHPAGDDCLQRVSRVLEAAGRRPLDLVGRIGGEEFAILLYGATPEQALDRAEALRLSIRQELKPDGAPITASIGVAFLGSGTDTLASLLSVADGALYKAKQGGRDQVRSADPTVVPDPSTISPASA